MPEHVDVEIPFLRPADGRIVAGVCAGVARRWRVDVTLVRAAAILLALVAVGLVLYVLGWILIPEE